MKIAFAGTPRFAATVLESLIRDARFEIALVISQPARRKGRGLVERPSEVEHFAKSAELDLVTPAVWDESVSSRVRGLGVDCLVTAAYGLMVPADGIGAARLGALNIHASLLPRWRGAAPIQRAIEAGDIVTGISVFLLEPTLDTGPVLAAAETAIGPDETSLQLEERLARMASELLPETLVRFASGAISPVPQSEAGASKAKKIRKDEGRLDWALPAETITAKFRAFQPWPGVSLGGLILREIGIRWASGPPGTVVSVDPLVVAAGRGAIELRRVRPEGRKEMTGAEFARGRRLAVGDTIHG